MHNSSVFSVVSLWTKCVFIVTYYTSYTITKTRVCSNSMFIRVLHTTKTHVFPQPKNVFTRLNLTLSYLPTRPISTITNLYKTYYYLFGGST